MSNPKKTKKIYLLLVLVLVVMNFIVWKMVFAYQDNKLYIHVLDVGQGDAIYLRTPDNQDIIIDGGPDNEVLAKLGELMPFYDRKIELMILTHPHEDHLNGLIEIIERYKVEKILMPKNNYDSAANYQWEKSIARQNLSAFEAFAGQHIDLGLASFEILNPEKDVNEYDNINNASIVAKLSYGKTTALFTGDAEQEVEARLVDKYSIKLKSDFIKAGHHGSKTSSTDKFINLVDPELAAISVGQDNKYKHPSSQAIETFEKNNVELFRTDYHGTVTCISDAVDLTCRAEEF